MKITNGPVKQLKSVAHNLAHHFASTLNYWVDDYAINHVWNIAKEGNVTLVRIDVLNGRYDPDCLNHGRAEELLPHIKEFLQHLLKKAGLANIELSEAVIKYDFSVKRVSIHDLPVYDCESRIKIRSGGEYIALLTESNNL